MFQIVLLWTRVLSMPAPPTQTKMPALWSKSPSSWLTLKRTTLLANRGAPSYWQIR